MCSHGPLLPADMISNHSHCIMRSLCGMSFAAWRRSKMNTSVRVNTLNFMLTRSRVQCYSTRRASAAWQRKGEPQQSREGTGEFYVVRKGDLVGVYKSFSECQKQFSASVCNPAVSVYKGHSLHKEAEEYLASRGLKGAVYSINAVDVKDDLFGTLVPCPLQDVIGHSPLPADSSMEHLSLVKSIVNPPLHSDNLSCILEYDGASKGNPGKAGAGAILRSEDGTVVSRLREGLGVATNNVAEYRAVILGMKYALKKGFKQIHIRGDSKLVCNQKIEGGKKGWGKGPDKCEAEIWKSWMNGVWRTRHQNLIDVSKEAKVLKDKFLSITIHHVRREFNSDADAEANHAVNLPSGEVYEVSDEVDYLQIRQG